MNLNKPTFLLNKQKVMNNIQRMVLKTERSEIVFRPHFKTHQSAEIGEWFREFGVNRITVSSIEMATYFANHGWNDITVAFPANLREIEEINRLTKNINLHLLVESKKTIQFLQDHLKSPTGIWIKIDVGHHRTGIVWNNFGEIVKLSRKIEESEITIFRGILTHSGQSYRARSEAEIQTVYHDTVTKMKQVRSHLLKNVTSKILISIGDTPTCSVMDDFKDVDEIRPGNFVFYDIMQMLIGSCSQEEIAVAITCPVVAKHKARKEVILYGGAIHFSKDFVIDQNGQKIFGKICLMQKDGWGKILDDCYVKGLSQEHGIVKVTDAVFRQIEVGDNLAVLPVHSCLSANLMRSYRTLSGQHIRTIHSS